MLLYNILKYLKKKPYKKKVRKEKKKTSKVNSYRSPILAGSRDYRGCRRTCCITFVGHTRDLRIGTWQALNTINDRGYS